MIESLRMLADLSKSNVRYVICGGLAINIYGIPRMTADIDIILDLEIVNIKAFLQILKVYGYIQSIPLNLEDLIDVEVKKKLIKENNLVAYSFFSNIKNVTILDVLVDVPISFEDLWSNRSKRLIKNGEIYLASIDHLIELKKYAGRLQDQKDIEALLKLK